MIDPEAEAPIRLRDGAGVENRTGTGLGWTLLGVSKTTRQDHWLRAANPAIAAALIVFTSPLMAFAALAIKLDSPGPVLHRQPRLGPDGRRFFVLRFRTMTHDPERASRPVWDRGARETGVGRFLRYTRIEDLPQLVNVLRGDMRLIGAGVQLPMFSD
jgi:lipopolysaccharide/colanic/teichoic acid biosynthesis glycosyltransferase